MTAISSNPTSAEGLRKRGSNSTLSRSMAAKIILDLEHQYADTLTTPTLHAALALKANQSNTPRSQAAPRMEMSRSRLQTPLDACRRKTNPRS
jgi:hypothetical protein